MADYYTVLDVDRKASQSEIRTAYRRLIRLYHPDLNPNGEEQSKKIIQAYSVLSDDALKAAYDLSLGQTNQYPHSQPRTHSSTSSGHSGYAGKKSTIKPKDFVAAEVVYLSLREALFGCELEHVISGPPNEPKKYRLKLKFKPSLNQTAKRFREKGYASQDGLSRGDILVQVQIKQHSVYKVEGRNLTCTLRVSVLEAFFGASIEFKSLAGGTLRLVLPPSTQNGRTFTFKGAGVPAEALPQGGPSGDLKVKIKICKPGKLTAAAKLLIGQLESELYGESVRAEFSKQT